MHMTAGEMHGERVYNSLFHDGAQTKTDLAHNLGISEYQVEAGLRHVREVVADREHEPLTYDRHTYRYSIAASEREAVRYLRYRLGLLERWMLNLNTSTAAPAAAKFHNPALDFLNHQMTQIKASIEYAKDSLPV